ncbi:hypothetical protein [Pontiella agarivorans]|uniref:RNA polymerase alpha subunit C-terminal domain-containing protein n=1 Tax=Pontiella agarivorans TaxID=3038953 RepID=A0ABU5MWA6_9BACT|nr:hypothetical protein [Pontiella agarivorans]MDZ8118493.1 hypothetical protein [Pontiella agarivorans]
MIRKFINKLRNNKNSKVQGKIPDQKVDPELLKMTVHQFADQSSVVMKGYRFSATLQPTVPLKYLRRHGEISPNIPDEEKEVDSPHFIWLPEVESKYSFLSEGRTVSSSVGPIDPDGGDFLLFLIALREIIEKPQDPKITDYQDALYKQNEILKLSNSKISNADDYLHKLFGGTKNQILEFVLQEIGAPSHKGLKLEHLEELSNLGFCSISKMLNAPDEVLLALKGIGPSKLKSIRENT